MKSSDRVLWSRRTVTDAGVRPAAVKISEGRIVDIYERPPPGCDVEDLEHLVLMPGLVDCHVHLNEPGRTDWEGFETATRAAAAGGITTLVDMPLNCIPVTTTCDALQAKHDACRGQLAVDCGFWGGVIPGNSGEIVPMAESGVLGFKAFLVHSGIDDFPNATEQDLRLAMPLLRSAGVPLLVHAELELEGGNPYADASPRAYLRYLHSRPREWEDAAIALVIDLVRETGCHAHIVHLSSASALPMIRRAKAERLPLTVETCPHYLCLTAEEIPDGATAFKCAPPIREDVNRELLWRGLEDGTIDFVISDHSPCVPGLKLPERGDFLEAWGGIASLQFGLRTVWTEAASRGCTLEQLTRWMAVRPAAFAGLGHRKGRIAPGMDADLVAWDPDVQRPIERDEILHRHRVTPYIGRAVRGQVRHTWLRGERIVDDGQLRTDAPRGQVLLGRNL